MTAHWLRRSMLVIAWCACVALTLDASVGHSQHSDRNAAARARFERLSDSQKQKLRESYRAFSKLSKAEQGRILKRYQHFRSLSSRQRTALREQYRAFQRLPSNERDTIRRNFERYRSMSKAHRERMREAYTKLTKLSPAERQAYMTKLDRLRDMSPKQRDKVRARLRQRVRDGRLRTKPP